MQQIQLWHSNDHHLVSATGTCSVCCAFDFIPSHTQHYHNVPKNILQDYLDIEEMLHTYWDETSKT